jgi:hypothetical protein
MPLYPPQNPHAARTRTRAAAVGSQRLTAWATARPTWRRNLLGKYQDVTIVRNLFFTSCFATERQSYACA